MFDNLFPTPEGQRYIMALGEFPNPEYLSSKSEMCAVITKIMAVMESQALPHVTPDQMERLTGACSSWGYGPFSSGPTADVANALTEAIWSTGSKRIKGPPFGPFGEQAIRKAQSCGMEMKCQFLTADTVGDSTTYSHVLARKGDASWWFAGYAIRSAKTLDANSPQPDALPIFPTKSSPETTKPKSQTPEKQNTSADQKELGAIRNDSKSSGLPIEVKRILTILAVAFVFCGPLIFLLSFVEFVLVGFPDRTTQATITSCSSGGTDYGNRAIIRFEYEWNGQLREGVDLFTIDDRRGYEHYERLMSSHEMEKPVDCFVPVWQSFSGPPSVVAPINHVKNAFFAFYGGLIMFFAGVGAIWKFWA